MEHLQNLFTLVFDIFKIYLKFGLITLAIYFVAEWYVLRYAPNFDADGSVRPLPSKVINSTIVGSVADKLFKFIVDFFIA